MIATLYLPTNAFKCAAGEVYDATSWLGYHTCKSLTNALEEPLGAFLLSSLEGILDYTRHTIHKPLQWQPRQAVNKIFFRAWLLSDGRSAALSTG